MADNVGYGLLAEFQDTGSLIRAARRVHAEGYRRMDAYTPFPVHGLADALGFRKTRIAMVVLIGGLIGCIGGYFMQYWMMAIDYPLNIGGRPLNSWPSYLPVTFECTILVAALFNVLGMLALNGLPRPHHPLFEIPQFKRANIDRFFLCIETSDPKFDSVQTRNLLEELQPVEVIDVP
jgi:hypothetical protein